MSQSDEELLAAMMEDEEKRTSLTSSLCTTTHPSTSSTSCATMSPPMDALRILKKYFGHNSFRPLQWAIIQNALNGKDQVVVLSTGYGKSVCYQLPSLYTEKLTVVISPLISLMIDQVENVRSNGIQAACISGETRLDDRQSVLTSDNLRLLYITPEFALSNDSFLSRIRKSIGLLAIDEAHCVSQWGHEFRPSYRKLAEIRHTFGYSIPVMALTATATEKVRMDIATSLELNRPIFVCAPLDRSNLYLSVRNPTSLEGLLSLVTEEDPRNGKHFGGPTIIYCSTRAVVNEVKDFLSRKGVKCGRYHAGMSAAARRKAHENFVKDRITTIVATVAFGMGIDKPDIRNVIHYGAPKNIESYYQEIGRAGRDGCPSKCITFYTSQELSRHRFHILGEQTLKEEYRQHLVDMLAQMERFLHATSCRRYFVLSYFDNHLTKGPPRAGCCDVCDKLIEFENSSSDASVVGTVNYGAEALILLRAVDIFQGYTGLGKVIDFIKGKANVSEVRKKSEYYGSGKHKTEAFWKELGRILRMNGYISERKSSYNEFVLLISLSDKGQNWLYNKDENDARYIPLPQSSEPLQSKILNPIKQRIWKDCSYYDELPKSVGESALGELENKLFEIRTNLAIERDCGAHTIASNKCIQQLAVIRPSCVDNLSMIGEMTEERQRKFGEKLVDVIVEFCSTRNMPMDCSADPTLPEEVINKMSSLNEAHAEAYQNHVKGKLSLNDIAQQRAVSESTVASYFVNFVKNGLPIHLDAIGINKEHLDAVYITVREHGSDILRLKPVMEKLPEGFTDYNRLKIIFAILEYEYGVEERLEKTDTNNSITSAENIKKRHIPEWMKKPAAPPVRNKKSKKSSLFG